MRLLIDPGHGGRSTGTLQGTVPEKELNLRVALKLAESLKGWEVHLTREGDTYLSLGERVEMVRRIKPDIFLSIHHNAYEEKVPSRSELYAGWEVVSPSYDLAYTIYGELKALLPGRTLIPPLPSTYTVVKEGPDVRLLTELFFASEMDERLLEVEVEVLRRSLERFKELPVVEEPDPLRAYGGWTGRAGYRTTRYRGPEVGGEGGGAYVVLRDGRAFWEGLFLARRLGARYVHTGMSLQKGDVHIALEMTGHSGITLILDYGQPEVRFYHTNREGKELAERVGEALGYPVREGSTYLLIHLYGPRILIRSRWEEGVAERIAEVILRGSPSPL